MRDDFAVFILTHGRAKTCITQDTLAESGYTGKYYFLLDDEDSQAPEYEARFGKEKIKIFCKSQYMELTDTINRIKDKRCVVYARNACFDIAKELGVRYFCELDDDYKSFEHRWGEGKKLKVCAINDMDAVFEEFISFLESTDTTTIALAQGGDFIGGAKGGIAKNGMCARKAMNSFVCDTQRRFWFLGTINEDVNAYITYGSKGKLFFTNGYCSLVQVQTQKNPGGLTEIYLDLGTFVKSFYSVICMPSCVRITQMGDNHLRIHHAIKWENCVPKIIREEYKKQA